MVRALLNGEKLVTRRLAKIDWKDGLDPSSVVHAHAVLADPTLWIIMPEHGPGVGAVRNAYGTRGDVHWVRETHACLDSKVRPGARIVYRADQPTPERVRVDAPWRPSIFLPTWASRLDLPVLGVRLERLHDIDDDDARAEGVEQAVHDGLITGNGGPRAAYIELWNLINGKREHATWVLNPWVWRIEYAEVRRV